MVCDVIMWSLETRIEKSFSYAIAYGAWRDNVKSSNQRRPKLSLWGVTFFSKSLCERSARETSQAMYSAPWSHREIFCTGRRRSIVMISQSKISLWDHGAKYMACLELCAPFPWSGSIRYPGNLLGFRMCQPLVPTAWSLSPDGLSFLRFTAL